MLARAGLRAAGRDGPSGYSDEGSKLSAATTQLGKGGMVPNSGGLKVTWVMRWHHIARMAGKAEAEVIRQKADKLTVSLQIQRRP